MRSLESEEEPSNVAVDPLTGMPNIDFGRDFTQMEIDVFLDED
jgi:hypothetical protein